MAWNGRIPGVGKPYQVQRTAFQRFWRMVVVGVNDGGCWGWSGPRISTGYSGFSVKVGGRWSKVGAHRYSYEQFVGQIPEGLQIDHLCRNPWCVNPKHLEAVTSRTNVLRSNAPPARNAAATDCIRGHRLLGYNLIANKGKRNCRECLRAYARVWHRLRREGKTTPPKAEMSKLVDVECQRAANTGEHRINGHGP